ncbi:hypothetical protein [Streptomyces sp. LNU-CPARS28]|uniref:hypothetical protein n=1 Tax=Streptomyces sp. LNU-CPARS28 TaxID=3137371 RepID=UPI0031363535
MAAVPLDLLDRIRDLERQVRELTGRAQMRPALNEILHGDVVIGEGGQLLVRSPTGVQHLTIGDLNTFYDEKEFGTVIRRRDGSTALSIFNGQEPDKPQVLRILDAQGHGLLIEDITAGGLYKPWLPLPAMFSNEITDWPSTTSGSFVTIQRTRALLQHPRIRAAATAGVSGNTAELRLRVDETTVATTGNIMRGTYAVPDYAVDKDVSIELQLRRASGTGTVWGTCEYLYGVGSA